MTSTLAELAQATTKLEDAPAAESPVKASEATGATAAVFAPGTVSFMPSLSLLDGSSLLALASSATGT